MLKTKTLKLPKKASSGRELLRFFSTLMWQSVGYKLVLSLILMMILGVLDGIGLTLLIPLMPLVGLSGETEGSNGIANTIASWFDMFGFSPNLLSLLAVYVVLILIKAFLSQYQSILGTQISQRTTFSLRYELFRVLTAGNWLFFSGRNWGSLMQTLTKDIQRVGAAMNRIQSFGMALLYTAIYLAVSIKVSFIATVIAAMCGGLLFFFQRKTLNKAEQRGGKEISFSEKLYSTALEHLQAMKLIKSYGKEKIQLENFGKSTRNLAENQIAMSRLSASASSIYTIGSALLLVLIVYTAVEILEIPGASLVFLIFLFSRLSNRVSQIHNQLFFWKTIKPALVSVAELWSRASNEQEIADKEQSSEIILLRSRLCFENISFSYPSNMNTFALRDLSFQVHAGETIAVVGSSGSGKSTLVDLILGLLPPSTGNIKIDELELTPSLYSCWRNRIGYVPQDTFLFNDSIRENLLWGNPDADENDLVQVLQLASAWDFVEALPDKMETIVGDRGLKLSGGERQRLSLARALLRKPSLLILDEATSALDSGNETQIQQAIDSLHGTMTIVMIAHRLSTIRNADKILVLENGNLVEQGDWELLINDQNSTFYQLAKAQHLVGLRPPVTA